MPRHDEGLSAQAFLDRWLAANIELNQELLDDPRVALPEIYLATNQEPMRAARIAEMYADHPWLTGILLSHELGYRKPDRAFFDVALARIGRRADCPTHGSRRPTPTCAS